jgi:PilZ domain-containing protein
MDNVRDFPRARTFLKAEISFHNNPSRLSCIVKDMSGTGARISISENVPLPATFNLYLPKQHQPVEAHIQWRRGDMIGVRFEGGDLAEKPAEEVSPARRIEQLENDNARMRGMLAAIRRDPSKLHIILDHL